MRKALQHTVASALLLMLALLPATMRAEDTTQDNRRCVYVVGGYQDAYTQWCSPLAIPENEEALKPYRLFETAPGSNVYTGYPKMDVPVGFNMSFNYFKIYTKLNQPSADDSHLRNNVIGVNESYDTEYTYNDDGHMRIRTQLSNNIDIAPFRAASMFWIGSYLRLDLNENELLIDDCSVYYLVGDFNEDITPTYDNIAEMRQWATRGYNMAALLDLPAGNHKIRLLRKLVGDGETVQTMGPASAYAGDWDAVVPQDRVVEWNADGIFFNEMGYNADNDVYDTRTIVSEGKSSWLLNNWPGGKLLFGGNGNMRNLEAVKKVYLIGDFIGWVEPSPENAALYADYILNETAPGSHVYTGRFNIPANSYGNDVFLKFCHALVNWNQLWFIGKDRSTLNGSMVFDAGGHASCPMGFGCDPTVALSNWTGGDVTFTFDMNSMTLTLDTDPTHSSGYAAVMGDINENVAEQPLPGNEDVYNMLWEKPKNSNRYSGTVYVPKGKFRLNFIPGFTTDGLGAPTVCPVGGDVELEWDGKTGSCQVACETVTIGSTRNYWTSADWPGGSVTIKVDPKHNKVTFTSDVKVELGMYLIGAVAPGSMWETPSEANREYYDNNRSLELIAPNVYEGDFFIEAFTPSSDLWEDNGIQFRFMRALRGWIPDYSLGSAVGDFYAESTPFVDGVARGTIIEQGLGNWLLEGYHGGSTLRFRVNLNDRTLTVTDLSSGLELNVVAAASVVAVPGGVKVSAPAGQQVTVYSVTGALVKAVGVPAGDTVITLPAGFYIVNGQKVAVR